jgi:hypothetical protein
MLPHRAFPAAHFDRNAAIPVTDLVLLVLCVSVVKLSLRPHLCAGAHCHHPVTGLSLIPCRCFQPIGLVSTNTIGWAK